jgi:predicted dinucleotide-utilizing enzyme
VVLASAVSVQLVADSAAAANVHVVSGAVETVEIEAEIAESLAETAVDFTTANP